MNHRESKQVPQGMRPAGHFLAGLLLAAAPGAVPATAQAKVVSTQQAGSAMMSGGYLQSHGAPPLRFSAIIIPANPAPVVVAAGSDLVPPAPASPSPASQPGDHPPSADVPVCAPESTGATVIASSPEKPAPLSILPDETRAQVRPEDFLPFFQVPNSGQHPNGDVIMPAPWGTPVNPPPIPSSATYIQK